MEFKQLPSAFLLMMASGCGTALAASNAPELFIMQQADKITVQGTVVDATGEPLIGVSVLELGTTNGAITDIDGKFSLSVASGSKLELSYIGYKSIQVEAKADLGVITLSEDTEVLEEVVVTALGIKREKKALGYAMQEVKVNHLLLHARQISRMRFQVKLPVCRLPVQAMALVDLLKSSCVVPTL